MQLRGGTGIFSGRVPFVWLGNQSSNTGIHPGYTFQVNATEVILDGLKFGKTIWPLTGNLQKVGWHLSKV